MTARSIKFTANAWSDYMYWHGQDKKKLKRINALIENCQQTPFDGIGKVEPLLGDLSGFWSRRIDDTHRLVYLANDNEIVIVACRYHYKK